MEFVCNGRIEQLDQEDFLHNIMHLCEHEHIKFIQIQDVYTLEVCPEGVLYLGIEKNFVSLVTQSELCGVGFHAYVAKLYDKIMDMYPDQFEVDDPTNYFYDRNFYRLKYDVFYPWLSDITSDFMDIDEQQELYLAWPIDNFVPEQKKNMIVTPLGYKNILFYIEEDIETIAEATFIWNEEEKDAEFYLKCAYYYMWNACYFEFSNMNDTSMSTAHLILDLLELVDEMDSRIPLPIAQYRLLCETMNRDVLIQRPLSLLYEEIGYRLRNVSYLYGPWRVRASGYCERNEQGATLIIGSPYKKENDAWHWTMYLNGFRFNQQVEEFMDSFKQQDCITWNAGDTFSCAYIEKEEAYVIHAQLNHGMETLLIDLYFANEEDQEQMLTLIKNIEYHVMKSDMDPELIS